MQTHEETSGHKSSTPQSKLLVIEREFDVPVSRLFEAFKTAEAIKSWWWPQGLRADRVDYDFREGGSYFISMNGHGGGAGGMTGKFEEIAENEHIVMSDQFADGNGRAISAREAKIPGEWPEVVYITFGFEAEGEGKTHLLLSQEGIPNEGQDDCKKGWSEMFDKLEAYVGGHRH